MGLYDHFEHRIEPTGVIVWTLFEVYVHQIDPTLGPSYHSSALPSLSLFVACLYCYDPRRPHVRKTPGRFSYTRREIFPGLRYRNSVSSEVSPSLTSTNPILRHPPSLTEDTVGPRRGDSTRFVTPVLL